MRKKRELILDFTSLLDVIMLILFFFVIFAQLDTSEAIAKAQAAEEAANKEWSDAKDEWDAANTAKGKYEEGLSELEHANALAESILINNTDEFNKGLRVKIYLSGTNEDWFIELKCPKVENERVSMEKIGKIADIRNRDPNELAEEFNSEMNSFGYSNEDALLCDLIYNSSDGGSSKARRNSSQMLSILQEDLGYTYLFWSITDLSEF